MRVNREFLGRLVKKVEGAVNAVRELISKP